MKTSTLVLGSLGFIGLLMLLDGGGASVSTSNLPTGHGSLPAFPKLLEREALEPGFMSTLLGVAQATGADADKLAALMNEESAFNPQAINPYGGASGLIQWLPGYAASLSGYTIDQIRGMTATQQLAAVMNTIQNDPSYRTDPAMAGAGKSPSLSDDAVLWTAGDGTYEPNKGYDSAGKGYITAGDIRHAVYDRIAGVGRVEV